MSGGGQARAFPKKALGRKWLIINERNFEKLNAMDRQCPGLPFILAGVKWQQASEEGGGKQKCAAQEAAHVGGTRGLRSAESRGQRPGFRAAWGTHPRYARPNLPCTG